MPRPAGMVPPVSAASTQFIGFRVAAGAPLTALLMRMATPLRPEHPDDLHVTLAFLGRCSDEQAQAAWRQCCQSPPPALPLGAGAYAWFGRPGRPRVLALELFGVEVLSRWMLANRAAIATAAGVAADMRPPRPHLSLARLGTSIDREAAEDLLAGLPLPDTTGIRLDTMALYRRASADAPAGGPRYRIVERHALAPGTGP